jgi:hypothetical protein
MSKCPQNLTQSFFTVCKITMFKVDEKVFFLVTKGNNKVLEAKKTIFRIWIEGPHVLVPSWVRYMSTKSHTYKRCETLRKKLFSTRGYAEIHIRRQFFDNNKSIKKIVVLKIQMVSTYFGASSTYKIFYFWKISKSQFLVVFQSPSS